MKLYVLVKVYQAVVDGVEVRTKEEDAENAFFWYTGIPYDLYKPEDEYDYNGTKIFEAEVEP